MTIALESKRSAVIFDPPWIGSRQLETRDGRKTCNAARLGWRRAKAESTAATAERGGGLPPLPRDARCGSPHRPPGAATQALSAERDGRGPAQRVRAEARPARA